MYDCGSIHDSLDMAAIKICCLGALCVLAVGAAHLRVVPSALHGRRSGGANVDDTPPELLSRR